MMRSLVIMLLLFTLSGCAAPQQQPEPRELALAAAPETTLREVVGLLMEEGYVIRHADAELGRVEAVLARWPGYRVRASITPEGQGARASLTATQGSRPLPPHLLDPLLAELQRRLGLAPR
ncbi:MAG: hypothetical protein LPK20_05620 [Halomonas sp.]|jgi:hypothetical protein|uniref:Lipoprotein n=1 Tax=Billgrantia tianxiuensis TaxID=2497861 RepID=A0A6I6SV55_9GAMM|nr:MULTISPECIES: hypothetical protein [Halomonas]MCE8035572.1 hypothetical protein [Halomonas sp. MCCC 1A11057]MDX5433028.1 hypothetical protein [Halomonas sp.]MDX5502642.1 hypothetical protein [Halomonas sp.]QHC51690.1 hypothetical protein EKK97_21660 [Halomonas tianxiuensis]